MSGELTVIKPKGPTFIDQVIGYFSPQAGLERSRARAAMNVVRGYEAARRPYRNDRSWFMGQGGSASTDVQIDGSRLRNRSRDVIRNNAWAKRIVDLIVMVEIGSGIRPTSKSGSKRVDKARDANWKKWAERATTCDADRQLDFYGIQALVRRTVAESGECLVRKIIDPSNKPIRMRLQVLEPDHLDSSRDGLRPPPEGSNHQQSGWCFGGIEHDWQGVRTGYWLFPRHPGDHGFQAIGAMTSVLVPADDICHVYKKTRPGQHRGVPELHAVMNDLEDGRDFKDTALVKAKTEACMTLFVKNSPDVNAGVNGVAPGHTEDGQRVETLTPGMIEYLRAGEEIQAFNPSSSAPTNDYIRICLQAAASGTGQTYHGISSDLSGANFSSLRAGSLDQRAMASQNQDVMLIPMFLDRVWSWYCQIGAINNLWDSSVDDVATWIPPKHALIDPQKELAAELIAVRIGAKTLRQMVESMGWDADEQFAEIAETNKLLDSLGIKLDSDPRNLTAQGQAQAVPGATAAGASGGGVGNPDSKAGKDA